MKPKTEQFLYYLLWSADQLMRPTFRNLNDSFETWAYRNGFLRQIEQLQRQRLIERRDPKSDERIYRLTAQGRLRALGGRDPVARWSRSWDGRWRLVLFDVPIAKNRLRSQLRRFLRENGFGYLQKSVWITPDPMTEEIEELREGIIDVESFIVLEARPCSGESNSDIVTGAWNFDQVNRLYQKHLEILSEKPKVRDGDRPHAMRLRIWGESERAAWKEAIAYDPLLPQGLLPRGYLGQRAWRERVTILRQAGYDLKRLQMTRSIGA